VSVFSRVKMLSTFGPTALVAIGLPLIAAHADTLGVGGCVGTSGSLNCVVRVGPAGDPYVRTIPQPETDEDKERAAARDRKWIDRCHPIITQDRFGVPRYRYATSGCEFGVIE
jgi:hypothetical protein